MVIRVSQSKLWLFLARFIRNSSVMIGRIEERLFLLI